MRGVAVGFGADGDAPLRSGDLDGIPDDGRQGLFEVPGIEVDGFDAVFDPGLDSHRAPVGHRPEDHHDIVDQLADVGGLSLDLEGTAGVLEFAAPALETVDRGDVGVLVSTERRIVIELASLFRITWSSGGIPFWSSHAAFVSG